MKRLLCITTPCSVPKWSPAAYSLTDWTLTARVLCHFTLTRASPRSSTDDHRPCGTHLTTHSGQTAAAGRALVWPADGDGPSPPLWPHGPIRATALTCCRGRGADARRKSPHELSLLTDTTCDHRMWTTCSVCSLEYPCTRIFTELC